MTEPNETAEPSGASGGSVANHDAVPAAIAPADCHAPRDAADRESVGTDKAEPLTRDCGTGNTPDRPKPIADARLAALERLSALDQELELSHGTGGNTMINGQRCTQSAHTTPSDGSVPREGTSERLAVGRELCDRLTRMNDANEQDGDIPLVSAACPRCGLTFSERVTSDSFSADEIRAIRCGANALRAAANRVASWDDQRHMENMADRIDAILDRLTG